MNHHNKCPKCGSKMKKIPIKRLDDTIIVELYCERCDYSMTFYPNINTIKFRKPSAF